LHILNGNFDTRACGKVPEIGSARGVFTYNPVFRQARVTLAPGWKA
jgi:hypothetical protein